MKTNYSSTWNQQINNSDEIILFQYPENLQIDIFKWSWKNIIPSPEISTNKLLRDENKLFPSTEKSVNKLIRYENKLFHILKNQQINYKRWKQIIRSPEIIKSIYVAKTLFHNLKNQQINNKDMKTNYSITWKISK
jgi:hypothetical protein